MSGRIRWRAVDAVVALLLVGLVFLLALRDAALASGLVLGVAPAFRCWSRAIALALTRAGAVVQLLVLQGTAAARRHDRRGGDRGRVRRRGAPPCGHRLPPAIGHHRRRRHARLPPAVLDGGADRIRWVSQRNRQAADEASRRAAAEQERTRVAHHMHERCTVGPGTG